MLKRLRSSTPQHSVLTLAQVCAVVCRTGRHGRTATKRNHRLAMPGAIIL